MSTAEQLSALISKVLAEGYQIDPEAFVLLSNFPASLNIGELVAKVVKAKVNSTTDTTITVSDVQRAAQADQPHEPIVSPSQVKRDPEVEIISDPTLQIAPQEAEVGFKKLFEDRYAQLARIAKKRPDSKNAKSIGLANVLRTGEKTKIVGLLSSRNSRKGVTELVLDDPTGTCSVLCSDVKISESVFKVPLDSLVILDVSRSKGGQLYANSLNLPDIPSGRRIGTSHRAYAVLLSDLHIGSRMFLQEDFERLLLWLNGGLGELDVVSRIRYLVIAGDLVDGVGVYPGQEYQLSEVNLRKQYLLAAQLISKIPKHIQVFVSPGNHDSVRQALPQPAVSLDIADSMYKMDNVKMVGNPAFVKLSGVTFLIYHGRSLDDVIATIPELSYTRPATAMQVLLRTRHLAPIYGKRTALSPEERDMLVIDTVPDVFHSGHVHTIDTLEYRGTLIVNSGTWQSQTHFQANMGLDPTPSIFPIVDLSTLDVIKRSMRYDFNSTS